MSSIRDYMNIINEAVVSSTKEPIVETQEVLESELKEFFGKKGGNKEIPMPDNDWMSQGEYVDTKTSNSAIDSHPAFEKLKSVVSQLEDQPDGSAYDKTLEDMKWDLAAQISRDTGIKATSIAMYADSYFVTMRDSNRGW